MFPLLLIAGLFGAGFWLFRHRPLLPSALNETDARSLLNFTPFTLVAARPTTILYIAPAGLNAQDAKAGIQRTIVGNVDAIALTRRQVPISPTVPGGPTLFADLWTMHCGTCGPPAGSPPTTINPEFVVRQIIKRRTPNIDPTFLVPNPTQQLGDILYASTVAVNAGSRSEPEFIPIAGRQS